MFQLYKIKSCAIVCFLFVISSGLATTGSKAEAQSPPPHQFAHHTLCETLIRLPNPGMDPKVQMDYSTEQWRCISTLSSRIEELQSQLGSSPSTTPDESSLPSTTGAEARITELERQLKEATEIIAALQVKSDAGARALAEMQDKAQEISGKWAKGLQTIESLQEAATAAASVTTPACACADETDVVAPAANGDMLTKQCQEDHAACMRKIRRGSNRVKAKMRNACNQARIGASGIQGTCG